MFESAGDLVGDALARFDVALDELLDLDLGALPQTALLDLFRGVERLRRRSVVLDHHLVAELTERSTAAHLGCRDTSGLLMELLRVGPGEARARVRAAKDLGPRRAVSGAALSPLFPAVASAQEAGSISAAHALAVVETVTALPASVERDHGAAVEAQLVEHAQHLDPRRLAVAGRRITGLLDPDGMLTDDDDHVRRRALSVRTNADGSADLRARLTPECLRVWAAVFDTLAAPRPSDGDGVDPRSAIQRRHDAMLDAGRRLLRTGDLPSGSGIPATVFVTMTLEQLEARAGVATTVHGGVISVPMALRIAAEAEVIPTVLGDGGAVLAYGRSRRIASAGQRLALIARDGGCSFPGCDSPGTWDDVHHVVPWVDGGATDLDNLTLLCGFHHRELDRRGWSVSMQGGRPAWVPPPWIDPQRRPVRNRTWPQATEP